MILTTGTLAATLAGAIFMTTSVQGILRRKKVPDEPVAPRPSLEIKFLSVLEAIKADEIVRQLRKDNVLFLNFQKIASSAMYRSRFMAELRELSRNYGAVLKMVSDNIVMVAFPTIQISTGVLQSSQVPARSSPSGGSHAFSPSSPSPSISPSPSSPDPELAS